MIVDCFYSVEDVFFFKFLGLLVFMVIFLKCGGDEVIFWGVFLFFGMLVSIGKFLFNF